MKYEVVIRVEMKNLDIAESYFKGKAGLNGQDYTINLQDHLAEKLIKLPIQIPTQDKVLVRLSGPGGVYVEDYLQYRGMSEWIEIDSKDIMHYAVDHQDQFDTLEICISVSD